MLCLLSCLALCNKLLLVITLDLGLENSSNRSSNLLVDHVGRYQWESCVLIHVTLKFLVLCLLILKQVFFFLPALAIVFCFILIRIHWLIINPSGWSLGFGVWFDCLTWSERWFFKNTELLHRSLFSIWALTSRFIDFLRRVLGRMLRRMLGGIIQWLSDILTNIIIIELIRCLCLLWFLKQKVIR